jgi:D-aminopeptidase
MLPHPALDRLFYATIEATEEAIANALLGAETMTGRDGITAHAMDPDLLVDVMRRFGRGPVADSSRPR